MRVILFRHGPAGERDPERWPDDGQRPLTPRGELRARRAARGLLQLEPSLRTVLTSPLERCARTARILREEAALRVAPEPLTALAPGGDPEAVLRRLDEESPEAWVALVGHEPDLGRLAGLLVFGAPTPLPLKKAGGCSIEFLDAIVPGEGRLRWFLPSRALCRLAAARSRV